MRAHLYAKRLFLITIASGAVIVGLLWARAHQTASSDVKICRKVDELDRALLGILRRAQKPLTPGEYGYAYWRAHPEEKLGRPGTKSTKGQLAEGLADLRSAACNPRNLPSTGG